MPYDQQIIDGVATRCNVCNGTLDGDENCPSCDEATAEVVAEEIAAEHRDEVQERPEEPLDPEDREALNFALSKDD